MRYVAFLAALLLAAVPNGSTVGDARAIVREAMSQYHLKALIVRITSGGRDVYTVALGESMNGVPATPQMHFRNGAMAFTYMSTLLLEMVDEKKAKLDDKLAKYYPALPHADQITLKDLAAMTSGYADYVYQPEVLRAANLTPFRHWSSQELIAIGIAKPMVFAPGTDWGYSHTNYVILGDVLAKITGMPLERAIRTYVLRPMGLRQTFAFDTPQIPEPVLHAYSSERREDLRVPAGVPFYEDSTYWDPSWTTASGAVEVTDIADMTRSMELAATGALLSKQSHQAQITPYRKGSALPNYGLGVALLGPWIAQVKSFAGSGATTGYLPERHLAITVVTTYAPAAFDSKGDYPNASQAIFASLAQLFAPGTVPKSK